MNECLFCGKPKRVPEKFCSDCGMNWAPFEPGLNEPAAIKQYKSKIQVLLYEASDDDHTETFDDLRKRLKIDFAVHMNLMKKIRGDLTKSEHLQAFRLEFDENVQDSFSGFDTRLRFRFSNLSPTERVYKVTLYWDDKETNDEMDFRAENYATVKPKEIVEIGSTHVFMRPGYKEIKGLEIYIEHIGGESARFRAETFHVRVGNPEQRVSHNVTNNISGRVLSVDMTAGDAGMRSDEPENKGAIWRNLSFVFVPPEEDVADSAETLGVLVGSKHSADTVPAMKPESQPAKESTSVAPIAIIKQAIQDSEASLDSMTLRDAVERMLQVFIKFGSMAAASPNKGLYLAMDLSLHLLETLHADTPDVNMDAIVGIGFESPSSVSIDEEDFVTNFTDIAAVVTLSGLTIFESDGTTILSQGSYTWGQIANNDWGLSRQRFGPASYLISFGNKSEDHFSGMRFDLRRYKGSDSVDSLYADAEAVLSRIFELAPAYVTDANGTHAEEPILEGAEDVENPEAEAANLLRANNFLEREKCLLRFFKAYAFVMQQCDETAPRSIFLAEEVTPQFLLTIHSSFGLLSGILRETNAPCATVDCNGVLYKVDVPFTTFYNLPAVGEKVSLLTHFVVRDDAQILYGFGSSVERAAFRQLIKISGVGPRIALGVLSGLSVAELTKDIALQDAERLSQIPSVGKKTAQRILLELKGMTVLDTEAMVVCVEPNEMQISPNGQLSGWNAAATVLTGQGIFHMVNTGDGTYRLDGKNSFLNWEKFLFEIKADIMIRDLGPDLWLGTADKFFIRGSYCDFSNNLTQWEYFEEFMKSELTDALYSFRKSIEQPHITK